MLLCQSSLEMLSKFTLTFSKKVSSNFLSVFEKNKAISSQKDLKYFPLGKLFTWDWEKSCFSECFVIKKEQFDEGKRIKRLQSGTTDKEALDLTWSTESMIKQHFYMILNENNNVISSLWQTCLNHRISSILSD